MPVKEFEEQRLLSGGDVIDRELEKLTGHLGALKLQNAPRNDNGNQN